MNESAEVAWEAPNSKESEALILGMMINSIDALNLSVDSLEATDFYSSANHAIFDALKSFHDKDEAVDEHLLIEELRFRDILPSAGGIAYIKSLNIYSKCYSNVEECIEIIKKLSTLRKLSAFSCNLHINTLKPAQDPQLLLEESQKELFKISQGNHSRSGVLIKDILSGKKSLSGKSMIEEIQERQKIFLETGGKGVPFEGVKTGFIDIDRILMGFGSSHFIILAARPAMGKTALALAIAENAAIHQNIPVGIFSLEMYASELTTRMLCSYARVEKEKVVKGSLCGEDFQSIYTSCKKLSDGNITIDDQSRLRISDLRVRARRMKESHNIGLLIIDYLQLISGSNSYRGEESRQVEVADISRSLKLLAKELHIPILCLAQLNRKVEERSDKRPIISDLRESGSLEQDADVIILLSRSEIYDKYQKPGLAQLTVAKNRHGPTGELELCYLKQFARFENYNASDEWEEMREKAKRSSG